MRHLGPAPVKKTAEPSIDRFLQLSRPLHFLRHVVQEAGHLPQLIRHCLPALQQPVGIVQLHPHIAERPHHTARHFSRTDTRIAHPGADVSFCFSLAHGRQRLIQLLICARRLILPTFSKRPAAPAHCSCQFLKNVLYILPAKAFLPTGHPIINVRQLPEASGTLFHTFSSRIVHPVHPPFSKIMGVIIKNGR